MVNLVRLAARLVGQGQRNWAVFEAGLSDLRRKRYREARSAFEALAAKGHCEAQYQLGGMLRQGQGAAADPARAAEWFRKAAEAGHGRAMGALGVLHLQGLGVPVDDTEAYKWLLLSAEHKAGWEDAELSLALLRRRMSEEDIARAEAQARASAAESARP